MSKIVEMEFEAAVPIKTDDGHWTTKREKRIEKIELFYEDRHRLGCNMCITKDYPNCRKTCQEDIWWCERTGYK